MSEKRGTPRPDHRPEEKVDEDLALIVGLGPDDVRRLHAAGITSLQALARMTAVDVAVALAASLGLSVTRIEEEDWIGQAVSLARTNPQQPAAEMTPAAGQRAAAFMVEFAVHGTGTIRTTRLVHIGSGATDSWSGWDETRLVEFLVENADLVIDRASVTGDADASEQSHGLTVSAVDLRDGTRRDVGWIDVVEDLLLIRWATGHDVSGESRLEARVDDAPGAASRRRPPHT